MEFRDRGNKKSLERFRAYLSILAEIELDQRFQQKIDPSDIVQETLFTACRTIRQFRGKTDAELAAWLRQILARKLLNAKRDLQCEKRDFRRERPLEEALNRSSIRLQLIVPGETAPSKRFERHEVALRVAQALNALPDDQRKALILKHWQDQTLAEIAARMKKTHSAVAGLLRRGLEALREGLKDL